MWTALAFGSVVGASGPLVGRSASGVPCVRQSAPGSGPQRPSMNIDGALSGVVSSAEALDTGESSVEFSTGFQGGIDAAPAVPRAPRRPAAAAMGRVDLECARLEALDAASVETGPVLRGPGPMLASFTARGARVTMGAHSVTLAAVAIRRGASAGSRRLLDARALPVAVGSEVRTERGAGVVEWWRALPTGLEHGVTVSERPAGAGVFEIDVEVGGDLFARGLSEDAIELLDARGARVATYAQLVVRDRDGALLPARMAVRGGRITLAFDDAGAAYPLVVDPLLVAIEEAALYAGDGAPGDELGAAVAMSADGTRALVGMPFDDNARGSNAGSARVFVRVGTSWAQEATLVSSTGVADDRFGNAVAISSDGARALVGTEWARSGMGVARVFVRTGTTWAIEAILAPPDLVFGDSFGHAVALSSDGSRAIVGAWSDDTPGGANAGSARVFARTGSAWGEETSLVVLDAAPGDTLGSSVALSADGARALVGAGSDDTPGGAGAGTVRVFLRSGTTWAEEATLSAADGSAGDVFGASVAFSPDGGRALVGAPRDDLPFRPEAGSVHVFVRTGTSWASEATLSSSRPTSWDFFGSSVAVSADGSRALIGAPADDTRAPSAGSAWVFLRSGASWSEETGLFSSDAAREDFLGGSVALSADGTRALVGSPVDDTPAAVDVGSARVFRLAPADADGAACTSGASCLSGFCVDGVCCASACGGGRPEDCVGCSSVLTGLPSGVCATLSAAVAPTVTCRPATDLCDAADVCSPISTGCADLLLPSTTPCRPTTSACDVVERCSGASAACPADEPAPAGTTCRTSSGACDGAEACDGASFACPADVLLPSGLVCRSVAGPCDTSEVCDGASTACPADGYLPTTVVCRASIGPCDVQDFCGGGASTCVNIVAIGAPCRPRRGSCDLAEACDGTSVTCPPDLLLGAGTECAPSGGDVCDAPDLCTGSTADCPPLHLTGVECRPGAGACDLPEQCSGSSPSCPPDAAEASGIVCRASTGSSCDPAEACDGVGTVCPADVTSCAEGDDGGAEGTDAGTPSDVGAAPLDVGGTDADAGAPPRAVAGCICRASPRPAGRTLANIVIVAVWLRIARPRHRARLEPRRAHHAARATIPGGTRT